MFMENEHRSFARSLDPWIECVDKDSTHSVIISQQFETVWKWKYHAFSWTPGQVSEKASERVSEVKRVFRLSN